jgi:hypothetical protein
MLAIGAASCADRHIPSISAYANLSPAVLSLVVNSTFTDFPI